MLLRPNLAEVTSESGKGAALRHDARRACVRGRASTDALLEGPVATAMSRGIASGDAYSRDGMVAMRSFVISRGYEGRELSSEGACTLRENLARTLSISRWRT